VTDIDTTFTFSLRCTACHRRFAREDHIYMMFCREEATFGDVSTGVGTARYCGACFDDATAGYGLITWDSWATTEWAGCEGGLLLAYDPRTQRHIPRGVIYFKTKSRKEG